MAAHTARFVPSLEEHKTPSVGTRQVACVSAENRVLLRRALRADTQAIRCRSKEMDGGRIRGNDNTQQSSNHTLGKNATFLKGGLKSP